VDAEVATLLQAGTTTLVGLMVGDAWLQVRDRIAELIGRSSREETAVASQELEASRVQLLEAHQTGDAQSTQDIEAEWRSRLRRLLAKNPDAFAELQAIVQEFGPSDGGRGDQISFASATFNGPVLGKGTQHNNFH
jgi:hypothetical protein